MRARDDHLLQIETAQVRQILVHPIRGRVVAHEGALLASQDEWCPTVGVVYEIDVD